MSTLKVNKIIPTAGVPTGGGGGIVQIQMNSDTTTTGSVSCSSKSTHYDVPNLNVTITPTTNTSKILVSFNLTGEGSQATHRISFRIKRQLSTGATTYIQGNASGSRIPCVTLPSEPYHNEDSNSTLETASFVNYLDSPSTTSAVTYTVQVRFHEDNSQTWYYNRTVSNSNNEAAEIGISLITVMEVSA